MKTELIDQLEDTRQSLLSRIAILEGKGYFSEIEKIAWETGCNFSDAWELVEEERASLNLRPRYTTKQSFYNAMCKRRYK